MLTWAVPQDPAGRAEAFEMAARRGRGVPDLGYGLPRAGARPPQRGAPGRSAHPPAAQEPPGDPHADPGGSQQAAGVPAAPAQRAAAAGTEQITREGGQEGVARGCRTRTEDRDKPPSLSSRRQSQMATAQQHLPWLRPRTSPKAARQRRRSTTPPTPKLQVREGRMGAELWDGSSGRPPVPPAPGLAGCTPHSPQPCARCR